MKIAQFISHFPYKEQFENPLISDRYVCMGGEFAAFHVIKNLVELGHDVSVFTSSIDSRDSFEIQDGIRIFRYGSISQVGETKFSPKLLWQPSKYLKNMDIVHVQHTTPPGGISGLICNSRWKKPLVVTHHGFERFDNYGSLTRRIAVLFSAKFYVDFLFARASYIISISHTFINKSRFLSKYPQKIFFIPNGVNIDEFDTNKTKDECRDSLNLPINKSIVLFIGSLIPRKGVCDLLDAMKIVSECHPDTLTILVGRGPLEAQFKQKVKFLNMESCVRFEGFIARNSLKSLYYRAADVLVIPSVNDMEMFPLVILEGAAAGCPMVTSDLETFRDFIHDRENGMMIDKGNPVKLASGIIEVLQSRDLQLKLSKAAKKLSQNYSWSAIAQETEHLYQRILFPKFHS